MVKGHLTTAFGQSSSHHIVKSDEDEAEEWYDSCVLKPTPARTGRLSYPTEMSKPIVDWTIGRKYATCITVHHNGEERNPTTTVH